MKTDKANRLKDPKSYTSFQGTTVNYIYKKILFEKKNSCLLAIIFDYFRSLLIYDLRQKKLPCGLNVCLNYEFNLLDHVGAVAKTKDEG